MVRVGKPKRLQVAWPPSLNPDEEDARPLKTTEKSRSESPVFHEAVTNIQELRDDECANEASRGSSSVSDDGRCDVSDNEDVFQMEIDKREGDPILGIVDKLDEESQSHSGSFSSGSNLQGGVPDLKPTESEDQEFEDVLAELNATESGDGSTEGWLGSFSEADVAVTVAVSKDDDTVKSETDAAVQKLIQSIKAENDVENKEDACDSSAADADEVRKLIDSVKSEAQVAAYKVSSKRAFFGKDETDVEAIVKSEDTAAKSEVKATVNEDAAPAKKDNISVKCQVDPADKEDKASIKSEVEASAKKDSASAKKSEVAMAVTNHSSLSLTSLIEAAAAQHFRSPRNGVSLEPETAHSTNPGLNSKVTTRKDDAPTVTEAELLHPDTKDSTAPASDGNVSSAENAVLLRESKATAQSHDALLEAKVKALLSRKFAVEPKLSTPKHVSLDKQHASEPKPTATKQTVAAESQLQTPTDPKAPSSPRSQAYDDDIAAFGSLFSDDTDYAVVEERPSTAPKPKEAGASSPVKISSLRAGLLSKAKEMVDLYKLILENDGFSGPEGEATRHFLSEMGSELKLKLGDSRDIANLKAELISKENEILQLEGCVANKNEMISDLRTKNISLRTKVDLLEDELETSKTREKYEVGRMEARLSSMELMHESVYEERDKLKKWKHEAEVTLKSQSADLDQLISQNSTLLDLCNEKEEFIKDLTNWKGEAEGMLEDQETKLDEVTAQASHLLEVCSGQQESIKELTEWKSDAEYAMDTQSKDLAELKSQNSSLLSRCNEQQESIEELTAWKTDATETLKSNEEELESLRTSNMNLTTQCTDQQTSIAKHLDDIKTLSHRLDAESFTVSRFEEDFLEHSKSMMNLKNEVQAKSAEIEQLQAKIDELNSVNEQMAEQAKNAPTQERENQEKEKMTMKMNHHKELVLLKNQKHDLAKKIDDLRLEQQEFESQIEALNGSVALLEKELKSERKKHQEAKQAVVGMEKALRAVEKQRKKLELKIKSLY